MKQNIILIILLVALFLFGLVIYDFSDQLIDDLTKHDWYTYENNKLEVMSFKKNKFSFYNNETKKAARNYANCTTFSYNKSINVIKLNCNITENKIYINSYDKETLKITINGEELILYSTKKGASEANFRFNNNLSLKEYNELININLTKYTYDTVDEIVKLYKSKNNTYVAFVNNDITYENVLNYKALDKVVILTNNNLVIITTNDLNDFEVAKLHEIYKGFSDKATDYIKNDIDVYLIGNKKVKPVSTISINNINEIDKFKLEEIE